MWHNFWQKIKGVMARMGWIQDVAQATSNIIVDQESYDRVAEWDAVYQGEAPWSGIHWQDVAGVQHSRRLMSLNMGQMAAKKMASLAFNQKAQVLATPKGYEPAGGKTSPKDYDNDANKFIHQVLQDNHFYDNFERYLEYMFAAGGLVIRTYVYNGQVKIRFATADSFYPLSQDANGVTECVIASRFVRDQRTYTLLEKHTEDDQGYNITNTLYESPTGTGDAGLGTKVPLATLYPDLKDQVTYPKDSYSQPTFIYLKPNLANNFDSNSPLGISIYANAMDTLHQLDQYYDMLMQEGVMGRRRIIAPDSMLKRKRDPNTGAIGWHVDFNDAVYQSFTDNPERNGGGLDGPKDITLALRSGDIIATINNLLRLYATQTGFSSGTFSYDGESGVRTATEVISANSDTYQTKNSHETIIEQALIQLCQNIVELGSNSSAGYTGPTDIDVTVNFDDSIAKDRNENETFYLTATGNKPLMPQREAIKRFNNLTDVEADQWLAQIKADEPPVDDIENLTNQGTEDEGNGS